MPAALAPFCLNHFPQGCSLTYTIDCPLFQQSFRHYQRSHFHHSFSDLLNSKGSTEGIHRPNGPNEVLPNGLHVYLLPDPEVPLIRGTLLMRGGQLASPSDKIGLASITAAVQRGGGSVDHPGSVMNDRLEELAAAIESSSGQQSISLDFQCMSEDMQEVLGLFGELVQQPALPADRLAIVKDQVLNALEHRNDNAAAVSRREVYKLIYGPSSIYARTANKADVKSITTADMKQFMTEWQRPDSAVLGLVGDFQADTAMEAVRQVFGSWHVADGQPAAPLPPPKANIPDQGNAGVVFLIDRPGASQASVSLAEPGISLFNPDVYPLDVLSSILNSFGGALFDTLRSREGLAYSVSGGWDTPLDHQGLFVASAETSQPGKLLHELQQILQTITEVAPTDLDVSEAKNEVLNSFVFNFSSKSQQLQRCLVYELLGLPQDFLFTYKSGIQAVAPSDVLRAAANHLHVGQQTMVITADTRLVKQQLEDAGFRVQTLVVHDSK
eukprot:jgi/Chrzof1/10647/Cz05g06170.t1